jgi:hypothetical protein
MFHVSPEYQVSNHIAKGREEEAEGDDACAYAVQNHKNHTVEPKHQTLDET